MKIEFEENFFRNLVLSVIFLVVCVQIIHPEYFVKYGEPEEKTVYIIEKEALEPTRYGTYYVPKVVALIEDKPVIYLVRDDTMFKQLPQEGEVKVV